MAVKEEKNTLHLIYVFGVGLILALPVLTLPPWFNSNDWGKTILFRSFLSILIFLFAYRALYKKNIVLPEIRKNIIFWLLIALLFIFSLATIFSQDYHFSLWGSPIRSGGFVNFAFYIALAILSFFTLRESDWKKVWDFSIFIGVLVALIAVIQLYSLFSNVFVAIAGRPSSTLGNPIFLAVYLLLLFFLTISSAIKEKRSIRKGLHIAAATLFLFVILITEVRAAWLGLIAGIFYFLIFYPKKIKWLKTITCTVFFLVVLIIGYANTSFRFPNFLYQSKIFESINSRLSLNSLKSEGRFEAWPVVLRATFEKPYLGWGPENQQIGFDKYYNPKTVLFPWWDRAHNVFLDIASQAGFIALAIYIFIFVFIFYKLSKIRKSDASSNDSLMAHSIQATLVAYLVSNFFSFDSFSSYLIFFLLIGYSAYLVYKDQPLNVLSGQKNIWMLLPLAVLFIITATFLWQYNFIPLSINAQINKAENLTNEQKCNESFAIMDDALKVNTILDAYERMKYVEFIKTCDSFHPENDEAYTKKGVELLKEAVKIQPLYARSWIYLGDFITSIASNEQNQTIKGNLINEAYSYFDQARNLTPLHTEVLIERAKTDLVAQNYEEMGKNATRCQDIDAYNSHCYIIKILAQVHMKGYYKTADELSLDLSSLNDIKFDTSDIWALTQMVDVFVKNNQYKNIIRVYEILAIIQKDNPKWHASLAAAYRETGQYQESRYHALLFLELDPEAKNEVDAFLKTLPHQ